MEYLIQPMKQDEYGLLEDFLYHAIFVPDWYKDPVPRSVIYEPELWCTIENFGQDKDDFCLVAEVDKKIIGAVWVRTSKQYGHIDNKTPCFSISLYPEYRNQGIGTELMKKMIKSLTEKGYKRASLSVQKENYAARLYSKLDFETVKEHNGECIMVKKLNSPEEYHE